jgi:hypothetical protein
MTMKSGSSTPSLPGPPSALHRLGAHVRLGLKFYLGLGAPASRAVYPECTVRAAARYRPELVRQLLAVRLGEAGDGETEEVNFRCVVIRPAGEERRFFFKEFPRQHALHDVERVLRCSRMDRAWRAAHLLPRMGILTPGPVGAAIALGEGGATEYLATEWLPEAVPYHVRLRGVTSEAERREMLCEFARHLRRWHDCGVYLRDLVTNVLTRSSPTGLEYWLTDLDQIHPIKRVTRKRLRHQMRQLARWSGPLSREEAAAIIEAYLRRRSGALARAIEEDLLGTPPADED